MTVIRSIAPFLAAALLLGSHASAQTSAASTGSEAPRASEALPVPTTVHEYTIDKVHSTVGFSIRHVVSKMKGVFTGFSGNIVADPADLAATKAEIVVSAASIDTRNEKRDAHLRAADFFDVEKHPDMRFRLTAVEPTGTDTAIARGDFTLLGVTKPIELSVTDLAFAEVDGKAVLGFSATTTIDREDYGMTWNRMNSLGTDVTIQLDVEAWQAAPAVAAEPAPAATPAAPATPARPAEPAAPARPATPAKPAMPATPAQPGR